MIPMVSRNIPASSSSNSTSRLPRSLYSPSTSTPSISILRFSCSMRSLSDHVWRDHDGLAELIGGDGLHGIEPCRGDIVGQAPRADVQPIVCDQCGPAILLDDHRHLLAA